MKGKFNRNGTWVSAINWDVEKKLGKVPDWELARKHGVGASAVRSARIRRGIPAYSDSVHPRQRRWNVDWESLDYIANSDVDIAHVIGCHPSTVRYHRNQLGIEPAVPSNRYGYDWPTILRKKENRGLTISELSEKYDVCKQVVEVAVNYGEGVGR
jgi:hypothetical protein